MKKVYSLSTKFNFGRCEGKTLKEAIDEDFQGDDLKIENSEETLTMGTTYVEWCIINIPNFTIDAAAFLYLNHLDKNYKISREVEQIILQKEKALNNTLSEIKVI